MTNDIPTPSSTISRTAGIPTAGTSPLGDVRPAITLLGRINREWQTLAHRPAVLRRVAGWDLGIEFESLDDVVAAAGFRPYRRGVAAPPVALPDGLDENEILARILRAARTDDLAARVALQRLLTGLLAAARRWVNRPEGGDNALEEVLGAAWTVIRTFPVERRPHHLVANLLRDSEYHAFRRAGRRLMVVECVATERLDRPVTDRSVDDTDPATELAELIAVAERQSLSPRDREVLTLLLAGHSQIEVAAMLDLSVRTVWNRREAVVHQLRQAARSLQAA